MFGTSISEAMREKVAVIKCNFRRNRNKPNHTMLAYAVFFAESWKMIWSQVFRLEAVNMRTMRKGCKGLWFSYQPKVLLSDRVFFGKNNLLWIKTTRVSEPVPNSWVRKFFAFLIEREIFLFETDLLDVAFIFDESLKAKHFFVTAFQNRGIYEKKIIKLRRFSTAV